MEAAHLVYGKKARNVVLVLLGMTIHGGVKERYFYYSKEKVSERFFTFKERKKL